MCWRLCEKSQGYPSDDIPRIRSIKLEKLLKYNFLCSVFPLLSLSSFYFLINISTKRLAYSEQLCNTKPKNLNDANNRLAISYLSNVDEGEAVSRREVLSHVINQINQVDRWFLHKIQHKLVKNQ